MIDLSLTAKLWSGMLRRWRSRRARAALSALDDGMLRDIGVCRHEIERLAEHEPAREATRLRALESCRQQAGRPEAAACDDAPAPASSTTENAGPGAAVIDLAGFRASTRRRAAAGFAAAPASAGRTRPH